MADNYLERKMAEHRDGKRSVSTSAYTRRGVLAIPFPPARVAIRSAIDGPVVDALLTTFRSTGSVAELCADNQAFEALQKRLGAIDITIDVTAPDALTLTIDGHNTRTLTATDPLALARLAAFLAAPANRTLNF